MRKLIIAMLLTPWHLHAGETIKAPNPDAYPTNQRRAYGNACGPASLLNAFHYGSKKWQKVFQSVPGHNSRSRIRYVVARWGNQPSRHLKNTNRWNLKEGVNLLDLTDMANEMCAPHTLPKVRRQVLTRRPGETRSQHLRRTHRRMAASLAKGLPPIINIRRYAYRYNKSVGGKSWWPIRAHFVVVTEIPKKLPSGAKSFKITYIDPYGGFTRQGTIHTGTAGFTNSPFLGTSMPKTMVGKSFVKPGEQTLLTLTAIVGTW